VAAVASIVVVVVVVAGFEWVAAGAAGKA